MLPRGEERQDAVFDLRRLLDEHEVPDVLYELGLRAFPEIFRQASDLIFV
jgi:hypothetical protein